jgi:SMI1-KNR4 cell-wall
MTIAGPRRAFLAASMAIAACSNRIARDQEATMAPITQNPSPAEKMQRVLKAWELAAELNYDYPVPAASPEMLAEAEQALGYRLPESTQVLYSVHDGGWYLGGNIVIERLFPDGENSIGLTAGTEQLREWGWTLPSELLVFGGDGSDGTYGLWMEKSADREPIVVETVDAGGSFAVVGDDLANFLVGRSAYYLLLYADYFNPTNALDTLEVPNELRGTDLDDEHYHAVWRWANPNLPDADPNSYDRWWTPAQIREFVATREG